MCQGALRLLEMIIDTERLRAISDPIERASAVDRLLEDLPDLQAELTNLRAEAVRELLQTRTGSDVAALLGVNRTSIYRAIRPWNLFRAPTGETLAEVVPSRTIAAPQPVVGTRVTYESFDGRQIEGEVISVKKNVVVLGDLIGEPKGPAVAPGPTNGRAASERAAQ